MNGVRVVVGEAAPAGAGTLRSILESEGFEVVGQASSAEQLQPVLAAADPQVIVFDAYTSATTVLSARDWAPRAGIVVVWPPSVLAPGADQQVEPARVASDLGDAVRRAVRIHRAPPAAPALAPDLVVFEEIPEAEGQIPGRVAAGAGASVGGLRPRRSELALALAAASIAFLVVAAIALQGNRPGFLAQVPSLTPPVTAPSGSGSGGGGDRGTSAGDHTPSLRPAAEPGTTTTFHLGPGGGSTTTRQPTGGSTTQPGVPSGPGTSVARRIPGVDGGGSGEPHSVGVRSVKHGPGGPGRSGESHGNGGNKGKHGKKGKHGNKGKQGNGRPGHHGEDGDEPKHPDHGGNGHHGRGGERARGHRSHVK
jgi:hypothetical protein